MLWGNPTKRTGGRCEGVAGIRPEDRGWAYSHGCRPPCVRQECTRFQVTNTRLAALGEGPILKKPNSFEVHLTYEFTEAEWPSHSRALDMDGTAAGWSYSKIDGDPAMGTGRRAYLTAHFDTYSHAKYAMAAMALRTSHWAKAARAKIEHVIFDTKAGDTL